MRVIGRIDQRAYAIAYMHALEFNHRFGASLYVAVVLLLGLRLMMAQSVKTRQIQSPVIS